MAGRIASSLRTRSSWTLAGLAALAFMLVAPHVRSVQERILQVDPKEGHGFPDTEVNRAGAWIATRLDTLGNPRVLARLELANALVLFRPGTTVFNVHVRYFYMQPYRMLGRVAEGRAHIDFQQRVFAGKESAEQLAADLRRFQVGVVALRARPDAALRENLVGLGWTSAYATTGSNAWEVLLPPTQQSSEEPLISTGRGSPRR